MQMLHFTSAFISFTPNFEQKIMLPMLKHQIFHFWSKFDSFTKLSRQKTKFLKIRFCHFLGFKTKCFHAKIKRIHWIPPKNGMHGRADGQTNRTNFIGPTWQKFQDEDRINMLQKLFFAGDTTPWQSLNLTLNYKCGHWRYLIFIDLWPNPLKILQDVHFSKACSFGKMNILKYFPQKQIYWTPFSNWLETHIKLFMRSFSILWYTLFTI